MAATYLSGCLLLLLVLGQQPHPGRATASAGDSCGPSFLSMPGLGIVSPLNNLPALATSLDSFPVSNAEECRTRCCSEPNCNLAMTEDENGAKTCYLANCLHDGIDVCELGAASNMHSYHQEVGRKPTLTDYCTGKPAKNACRANLEMWWYDAEKKSCSMFFYGGCDGKLNTYVQKADCLKKCKDYKSPSDHMSASKRMVESDSQLGNQAVQSAINPLDRYALTQSQIAQSSEEFKYEDYCTPKAETGLCRAAFPRWSFDTETNTCKPFTYGGCGGNKNNYESEKACMDQCLVSKPDPQKQQGGRGNSFQEYCAVSKVTGPCRAAFPRWYYDITSGSCIKFIYGGCKGNKNNYLSREECDNQCANRTDEHENYDPLRPFHHSTTAVALAVLLAVMIAILLGAMVVVFVKMARRHHRDSSLAAVWSPIDDKECLMNNAYTL